MIFSKCLNKIYYSDGVYGVGLQLNITLIKFEELNLAEEAYLAGLPQF